MTLAEREYTNLTLKVMSSQDLINKSIEQLASQVSGLVSKDEEIKLLRLEITKLREENAMLKAALDEVSPSRLPHNMENAGDSTYLPEYALFKDDPFPKGCDGTSSQKLMKKTAHPRATGSL
jgi:hypothetical protein